MVKQVASLSIKLTTRLPKMAFGSEQLNVIKGNLNFDDSCELIVIDDDTLKEANQTIKNCESSEININSTEVKESNPTTSRTLRRRRATPLLDHSELPSKKRKDKSTENIENYYLCKKVKRLPSNLETIFEEPKQLYNTLQYIGMKKMRRYLHFNEDLALVTKLKFKRRQAKAKKLQSSKGFLSRKKIPMHVFMKRLMKDTEK